MSKLREILLVQIKIALCTRHGRPRHLIIHACAKMQRSFLLLPSKRIAGT